MQGCAGRLHDVAAGDVTRVKAAILDRYGFVVNDQYAADLVAFVEELTREPRD